MLRYVVFFLGVWLALALVQDESEENLIVHAPVDKIRGSLFKTILGKTVYAYRNVRYAEPSVGHRRFQAFDHPLT